MSTVTTAPGAESSAKEWDDPGPTLIPGETVDPASLASGVGPVHGAPAALAVESAGIREGTDPTGAPAPRLTGPVGLPAALLSDPRPYLSEPQGPEADREPGALPATAVTATLVDQPPPISWWRSLVDLFQGRVASPAPVSDGRRATRGSAADGEVAPGSPPLTRPPVPPPSLPPPSPAAFAPPTYPVESPAPWEGGRVPPDPDPGHTRRRLLQRLRELAESAPSRVDAHFIDRIIRSCSAPKLDFPLFPQSVVRLHRLLAMADPPRQEVVNLIRQEPGMMVRIWREARTPGMTVNRDLPLEEAVVRIGQRRLWEIGIAACMDSPTFRIRDYQARSNNIRGHSIVAAEVSHLVSVDCFLPALLHAMGRVLIYRCGVGRSRDAAGTPEFVVAVADHVYPIMGMLVADAWELGPAVALGIGYAPAPERAPPAYQAVARATRAVSIAAHEAWAHEHQRSFGGEAALRELGMDAGSAADLIVAAVAAWRRLPEAKA